MSLKASEIDLSFEPAATSVYLTAFLLESPQRFLPRGTHGGDTDDIFMQDVTRVMLGQHGIEDRITLASALPSTPSAIRRSLKSVAACKFRNGKGQ